MITTFVLAPSSDKEKREKHCRTRRKAQVTKTDYFEKGQVNQYKSSIASSERDTNSLSSGHQCFSLDLRGQLEAGGIPL